MNHSQLERRWGRAHSQAILVQRVRTMEDTGHMFALVSGTSGDAYNVQIHNENAVCTCIDFGMRFRHNSPLCKHIIAVLLTHFAPTLEQMVEYAQAVRDDDRDTAAAALAAFSPAEAGVDVVVRRNVPKFKLVDPRKTNGKKCPICLSDMVAHDTTFCGGKCGAMIHKTCIEAWLKVGAACPLCRSAWVDGARMCKVVTSKVTSIKDALV